MHCEQFRDPKNPRRIVVPEGMDPDVFLRWILTHPEEKVVMISGLARDDNNFHPVKIDETNGETRA